jgi:hypothetical protein
MKFIYIITLVFLLIGFQSFAQDKTNTHTKEGKRIIQFHGLVLEGDSLYGVGGARVYDPSSHRGATTGVLGYFSFPVVEGDSITVVAVGYRRRNLVIPSIPAEESAYFMKIMLSQDTIILPEYSVGGLPPEQVFKDAVLAYSEPYKKDMNNADRNLNDQIMSRLLENSGMSANMNHAYYMQQQVQYIENRYMATSSPFLDPFAWNRFFKDVEREKEKKQEAERKKNNIKPY